MSKPSILIIDDRPENITVLRPVLKHKYDIHATTDAEDGLKQARILKPNVIILDIMMPKMDGFQVLRELRRDPQTENTMVIMLTARVERESLVKGLREGADEYIIRPYDADILEAKIDRLLVHQQRQSAVPSEAVVPSTKSKSLVFISYSSEDKPFAQEVSRRVALGGCEPWIDHSKIKAGDEWIVAIDSALSRCDCMVVIMTPDSIASDYVRAEWIRFLKLQKTIVPILYKPCDIPFLLDAKHWIDFTKNHDNAYADLVAALGCSDRA